MYMIQHVILSAIGSDRPGLVDEVSRFIFDRGGNIEDSRMANLRGQFAIMMLVGGPEPVLARIKADIPTLQQASRLHVELHAAVAPAAAVVTAMPYRLTATAMDQAGLVQSIAHLLGTLNVNIESMQTTLSAAPITGAPVFEMELILSVPGSTSLSRLRDSLNTLCNQLNIDWDLSAL
jgi:glycine cleavage system transcriptional repressor